MEKKVLVVDDEAHIRLLIEQALEDLGDEVEIFTAGDGLEALDVIQTEHPRLVFLDVMMPKLDGFDVCDTVKHRFAWMDIVIVLLTAKGQETDRQRGEQAGADYYLTKPFNPDELVRLSEQILDV